MTRGVLAATVVLALASLTACTDSAGVSTTGSKNSGTDAGSEPTTDSTGSTTGSPDGAGTLEWGPCDDEKATDTALQCATLDVPVDYDDPDGESISLALVRVPATGERTGAVLFNPGGPGGSGFDSIAQGGSTISSELGLADFDLVGFDPRGVDRSNGIRCLTDAQEDQYAYLDDTPDTAQEEAALDEADGAFQTACVEKYGSDTLQHYSTTNTARDMDAIRTAMGDDTISYLGVSYGTYLGAVYATMFPDHVRALVLDSAYEPTGDTIDQQYETQLVGFEGAFDEWAEWCESNDACAFSTVADAGDADGAVGAAWDALLQQLDDDPVTNDDGRIGNQVVMRSATITALYSKSEWPVLGTALADVANGDAAGIFRLADSYSGRDEDGHYTTIDQSNRVINCASGFASATPPDPEAYAEHLRSIAPRFGGTYEASDFDEQARCDALMPAQPTDTLSYSGDAPIVVVGGTNDPATPIRWAEEMTDELGPSATMVTYTGEGHGQLLASTCVTKIEAAVLVDLTDPDDDTVCAPDPDVEEPAWWDSIPTPDGIDPAIASPELNAALGITTTDLFSELRTSDLSPDDVLAAYQSELTGAGFEYITSQEPIPDTQQAIYNAPGGDLFSLLVIGPDGFSGPELESAADLVPPGKTIVYLLYIPA